MSRGLKPYPAYRDSGVEWLGEVPEHWGVLPLKRVAWFKGGVGFPAVEQGKEGLEVPFLKVSDMTRHGNGKWIGAWKHTVSRETAQRLGACVLPAGSLIFPKVGGAMLTNKRRLLRQPSCIDNNILGCVVRHGDVEFLFVVFQQLDLGQLCKPGPVPAISEGEVREIDVPFPPLKEQSAIGRFLNHVDRRIRRYVRSKQKLIALLHEQRQAVIHRAVTRGLAPGVRLKPSGVEWLGDVPEHWKIVSLRRRWTVMDCKHLTVPFVEEGIPLASVCEVQSFDLDLAEARRTTTDWYEVLARGNRTPRRGDLIYCRNVSVGAAAFVDTDEQFAMGQDVCMIRSQGENQRYLNYFLRGPAMGCQLAWLMVGSTFDRINVSEVKGLIIAVPPRAEQDAISGYLDESLRGIHKDIEGCLRGISLLREYRTRFISDVVTGKLDVREAAAHLPEETGEPEPLDDTDTSPEDISEETEATDPDAALEEAEA
jgi:type I restriction enzyme S subunit